MGRLRSGSCGVQLPRAATLPAGDGEPAASWRRCKTIMMIPRAWRALALGELAASGWRANSKAREPKLAQNGRPEGAQRPSGSGASREGSSASERAGQLCRRPADSLPRARETPTSPAARRQSAVASGWRGGRFLPARRPGNLLNELKNLFRPRGSRAAFSRALPGELLNLKHSPGGLETPAGSSSSGAELKAAANPRPS